MHDNVDRRIRTMVADQLIVAIERIEPSSLLQDNFGADELDIIGLACVVEEAFDIAIDDEVFTQWRTVSDIAATVEAALAARKLGIAA